MTVYTVLLMFSYWQPLPVHEGHYMEWYTTLGGTHYAVGITHSLFSNTTTITVASLRELDRVHRHCAKPGWGGRERGREGGEAERGRREGEGAGER